MVANLALSSSCPSQPRCQSPKPTAELLGLQCAVCIAYSALGRQEETNKVIGSFYPENACELAPEGLGTRCVVSYTSGRVPDRSAGTCAMIGRCQKRAEEARHADPGQPPTFWERARSDGVGVLWTPYGMVG
jgi:hypothetical protein